MDLSIKGPVVTLRPGTPVSLQHVGGRRITNVSGAIWVTRDGEQNDLILESGEDLVLAEGGRIVLQALGGPALVALEDGIALRQSVQARELDPAVLDHQEIDRHARGARAEATRWLFRELRAGLGRLWARVNDRLLATRTRDELHALSDHMLKDIGVRRTEIDCLAR